MSLTLTLTLPYTYMHRYAPRPSHSHRQTSPLLQLPPTQQGATVPVLATSVRLMGQRAGSRPSAPGEAGGTGLKGAGSGWLLRQWCGPRSTTCEGFAGLHPNGVRNAAGSRLPLSIDAAMCARAEANEL